MTHRILTALTLTLGLAGLSAPSLAQVDHSAHMQAKPAASAPVALEDATVKKIDKAAGKVSLAHGALANGMPAMTMVYRVKNPAWLDQLKVGQKVRFAVDPAGDGMTVIRFDGIR
ncbi:MAG: copper-binding protein [Rhodoferax sp.]